MRAAAPARRAEGNRALHATGSRRVPWLLAAGVFALAFVLLGVAVTPEPTAVDLAITRATSWLPFTDAAGVLELANWIGQAVLWMAVVAVVALAFAARGRWRIAALLVAGLGSEVFVAVGKSLFDRARPLPPLGDLISGVDTGSYPSGHVVRLGVTLGVLLLFAVPRGVRAPTIFIAAVALIVMALARVAYLEHWPTDTLGGLLLAMTYLCMLKGANVRIRRPQTVGT